MELKNSRPLEAITKNNSFSMLESLIPFVDYPMKLPLALLIKYNEIRLIMNAFRSLDNLSRLGLHNPSREPMDMLGSLLGISPDMLKMMFSMMEKQNGNSSDLLSGLGAANGMDLSSLFQAMSGSASAPPSKPDSSPLASSAPPADSGDFESNIQNILSEYDMAQAAEFSKEVQENTTKESEQNPFHIEM